MKKQNKNRGLLKGLILGPVIGGFLGFFVLLLMTGKLPFSETDSFGLGDMSGVIAIFYLYSIVGGAILGFIIGVIIGSIIDSVKK